MSIGDKHVAPHVTIAPDGASRLVPGMTYREWLIGMIACGTAMAHSREDEGWNFEGTVLERVDWLLTELDAKTEGGAE